MEFTTRMRSMYNADLTPEYQRSPVKELRGDKGLNYTARHSHLNKRDTACVLYFCAASAQIYSRNVEKFFLFAGIWFHRKRRDWSRTSNGVWFNGVEKMRGLPCLLWAAFVDWSVHWWARCRRRFQSWSRGPEGLVPLLRQPPRRWAATCKNAN